MPEKTDGPIKTWQIITIIRDANAEQAVAVARATRKAIVKVGAVHGGQTTRPSVNGTFVDKGQDDDDV